MTTKSSRRCSVCGEVYHRRNLTEAWVMTNPGHREGWKKEISKVCIFCCNAKRAMRTINVATLMLVPERTKRIA